MSFASAYVSVLAPDGSPFVRNVLVGTGGAFVDARALPSSGTFSIVVDPTGGNTGSITLALHDVPADVSGELIAGASALTVAITTPGQNARLTFQGTAGRRVSLVLSSVSISSSLGTILRPNGTTLAAVLVSATGRTLALDLSATGTYVVLLDPRTADRRHDVQAHRPLTLTRRRTRRGMPAVGIEPEAESGIRPLPPPRLLDWELITKIGGHTA